jgi:hypothetical protein
VDERLGDVEDELHDVVAWLATSSSRMIAGSGAPRSKMNVTTRVRKWRPRSGRDIFRLGRSTLVAAEGAT